MSPSISDAINATAAQYSVRPADIKGPRRYAEIVLPRHVAMYCAYSMCKRSLKQVGRAFGGRHHTTVIHAFREVSKRIVDDGRLATAVKCIGERMKAMNEKNTSTRQGNEC